MPIFKIVTRQVFLHLSEGAEATPHHEEYDIVRIADNKTIRTAVKDPEAVMEQLESWVRCITKD